MKQALLVGGTAATGRAIINQLQTRGYEVTLYNRGRHNVGLDNPDVKFIVGDPHFRESIAKDLGGRDWDVTVASYGRTRLLAEALSGHTGQFVGISGTPVCRTDLGLPLDETDPVATLETAPAAMAGIVPKIAQTEEDILRAGAMGGFDASIVRYPYIYGPHSLVPMEWHVIKRVLDGRKRWALTGGGLHLSGRCASANAAALVGAVIEKPKVAAGKVYIAADDRQMTQRDWVAAIAGIMGHSFDFVDIPASLAPLGSSAIPMAGELPFNQSAANLAEGYLHHSLPSATRAKLELGYREAVDPLSWIERTVHYWLDHPFELAPGNATPLGMADFDYDAEDALLAWWDGVTRDAPSFGRQIVRGHPYDHPKATGRKEWMLDLVR